MNSDPMNAATCFSKPIATTCGWCRDAREQTARLSAQGFAVSHSICPPCKAKLDAELGQMEAAARAA